VHSTHCAEIVSQRGAAPPQSEFEEQPMHWPFDALQM
jgi:hypothetical protein